MKFQLQANVRWQGTAWQMIILALVLITSSSCDTPTTAQGYFYRGSDYLRQGELNHAIQDFNQAILLDPKYAAAYESRGVAYLDKHEYDHAIDDFTSVIALVPTASDPYTFRGLAYRALGKNDLADADDRKAQQLSRQKP